MPITKFKPIPELSEKKLRELWNHIEKRGEDECWPWMARCNDNGYAVLSVWPHGDIRVTRILLKIIKGIDPDGFFAIHDCENRLTFIGRHCCNPNHIVAGSHEENMAYTRGKPAPYDMRGANHPMTELTDADIITIRERRAAGETNVNIQKSYPSVNVTMISHICTGLFWRHIGGPRTRDEKCIGNKLTSEGKTEIFRLRSLGWSQQRIADLVGVNQARVSQILRGK